MANEIFACVAECYSVAQVGPIPAATGSELSFSRFYNSLVKRKADSDAATLENELEQCLPNKFLAPGNLWS